LQEDLNRSFRATLEAGLSRLDLVTREEFDVQAAVLARSRAKLDALEQRVADRVAAAGDSPEERAEALVEALNHDGYAASARPVGDDGPLAGVQLCQGHCPVQHVASEFPELCEAETEAFGRLLGVHVQRLATLAHGDHVCTTFVPTPTERKAR